MLTTAIVYLLGSGLVVSLDISHFQDGLIQGKVYAQASSSCPELIRNGDFEASSPDSLANNWVNANDEQPAVTTSSMRYSGNRALQIGLVNAANTAGVSVARQTVRLPQGDGATILSWHYLPLAEGEPSPADLQYVEIFNDFNSQLISRPVERRSNDRTWRHKQFDLTPYNGQQVTIYFGVRNDGEAGKIAMIVDDVSLTSCNSIDDDRSENRSANSPASQVQPFLTSTPTPTPTPTVTSTPSATSTSTSTPTPTSTTFAGNTPVVCSTSVAGPLFVSHVVASDRQSATINITANNSTQVNVSGPNNFSYTRSQGGPYAVTVPLQPNSNVFTVSVMANRTNSNCLVENVTLSTPLTISGSGSINCPTTTPEPFTAELLATDNPLNKIIRVVIGNGDRVTVRGPFGTIERTGISPFDIPIQLTAGILNTIEIDAHVRPVDLGNGCIVGNYTLRKTLTYDSIATPIPGPTVTPIPPITPSTCGNISMAPRPQSCKSILVNGGFETNDGWHFGLDPVRGVYTHEQVSVGARSVLLGNPHNRGSDNIKTYSSIRQFVTIPSNVDQLQLRWRRLDISEDAASGNPSNTEDRQDVIILSAPHLEPIEIISRLRCNTNQWEEFSVDLDAKRYAHERSVAIYFNVFNDGLGGRSWSYIDNVELLACPDPGDYTDPNLGAGANTSAGDKETAYVFVKPPAFSPTSTYTPGPAARATYTPYTVVLPTETSSPQSNQPDERATYLPPAENSIVATSTPFTPADLPADSSFDDVEPSVGQQVNAETINEQDISNRQSTGLVPVSEVEASNQFIANRPWFNWMAACSILLAVAFVLGYIIWTVLQSLADRADQRKEYDNS